MLAIAISVVQMMQNQKASCWWAGFENMRLMIGLVIVNEMSSKIEMTMRGVKSRCRRDITPLMATNAMKTPPIIIAV